VQPWYVPDSSEVRDSSTLARFRGASPRRVSSFVVELEEVRQAVWDAFQRLFVGGIPVAALEACVDAAPVVIPLGVRFRFKVPYDCRIVQASLYSDIPGNLLLDIVKTTHAAYPVGVSIVGAAPPALAGTDKYEDNSLTGWAVDLAAGDILLVNFVANDVVRQLLVSLQVVRF